MDDLISRQAAIDLLKQMRKDGDMIPWEGKDVFARIRKLPTIQPELSTNLAEVGTDCISRQQAIDAFNTNIDELVVAGKENADAVERYLNRVIDEIKQLPTIQPKRGKWIKTARWGRVYYCNQCRNYLDFDGVNAGRGSTNFCPNCGCRMDGGEQ